MGKNSNLWVNSRVYTMDKGWFGIKLVVPFRPRLIPDASHYPQNHWFLIKMPKIEKFCSNLFIAYNIKIDQNIVLLI